MLNDLIPDDTHRFVVRPDGTTGRLTDDEMALIETTWDTVFTGYEQHIGILQVQIAATVGRTGDDGAALIIQGLLRLALHFSEHTEVLAGEPGGMTLPEVVKAYSAAMRRQEGAGEAPVAQADDALRRLIAATFDLPDNALGDANVSPFADVPPGFFERDLRGCAPDDQGYAPQQDDGRYGA